MMESLGERKVFIGKCVESYLQCKSIHLNNWMQINRLVISMSSFNSVVLRNYIKLYNCQGGNFAWRNVNIVILNLFNWLIA